MHPPYIVKLLSLHEKGMINAPETANGLLVEFVKNDDPDFDLPLCLSNLPSDVQPKLRDLLHQIQRGHYYWQPFLLGPGGSVLHSATEDSLKLRRICMMLEVSPSPAASSTD